MARPKTPTKLLDARGAFKKHPERKREGEPEVKEPVGAVPDYFSEEQRAAWQQIVEQAPMGVLTQADTVAIEGAACLLAEMRADPAGFAAGKWGRLEAFLGQFGMTPAKRAALNIAPQKSENPFDDY